MSSLRAWYIFPFKLSKFQVLNRLSATNFRNFHSLTGVSASARAISYCSSKSPQESLGLSTKEFVVRKFQYSTSPGVQTQVDSPNLRSQDGAKVKMVRPTGVLYNWNLRTYEPEQITTISHDILNKAKTLYNSVGSLTDKDPLTFDTVLKPILQAHRLSVGSGGGSGIAAIATVPLMIAESSKLRDAAAEAKKLFSLTSVEQSMRTDVFEKLVAYKEKLEKSSTEIIDPEYKRCLDRLVKEGRKNGLHLSPEIRDEVSKIKSKILELELQFGRNLIEHKAKILFNAEELAGMPSDFIESLEKDEETGKYIVTLEYPHLFPILKKCRVPATREKMQRANYSKCHPENTKLLDGILKLRHQEATVLGYKNHASYVLDGRTIASKPEAVTEFLDDLTRKLQPLWEKERAIMLDLKAQECEKYGYENSGKLDAWDTSYYSNLVEEKFYNLDHEQLRPYFPFEAVTKGMLEIYEQILGLKFTHIPDAEKWNDDVQVYQVNDANTSQLIGYFYLDLFPREGKYGHACYVPLQVSTPDQDGVQYPIVAAMIANFTKPTKDKPSLLTHGEVETFFHEFGHVMHGMCTKAKTSMFFGTGVETDFLEAPSQMLENWVWEREPLRRMSAHFQTGEPLPDEMIENLVKTKKVNAGGFNLRQISLGKFDQLIHLEPDVDTAGLFAKTVKSIQGLDVPEGTNFAAGFGHIGKGYSARYYSYLWSEVFSMDMFDSKFSTNVLNPEMGKLYRQSILEPGGSIDAKDMLRNFLGRDPNSNAFLESKGVSVG